MPQIDVAFRSDTSKQVSCMRDSGSVAEEGQWSEQEKDYWVETSANERIEFEVLSNKTLSNNTKRLEERTEPCGRQQLMRKEEIDAMTSHEKEGMLKNGNLATNVPCHTLSKALETSRAMTKTHHDHVVQLPINDLNYRDHQKSEPCETHIGDRRGACNGRDD